MNYDPKELVDDYLAHHGIQGQKWGVRHGPPYPLDREVSSKIKKSGDTEYGIATEIVALSSLAAVSAAAIITSKVSEYKSAKLYKKMNEYKTDIRNSPIEFNKLSNPESPNEAYKNVNPGYPEEKGSRHNCTYTVLATEMRCRGYDVVAKKTEYGVQGEYINNLSNNNSLERFDKENSSDWRKILDSDLKKQGPGARGMLSAQYVDWDDGHSFMYFVDNKGVHYTNPQCSKELTQEQLNMFDPDTMYVFRLDNADLNGNINHYVENRR